MEKELFAKSALLEGVQGVLDNVMPEKVLLGAIMELQTTDIADLQQESVKGVVSDLRLLQGNVTELKGLMEELKDAAAEEDAMGLDEEDNALCEAIDAAYSINEGYDQGTVLGNAVELFEATSVEQLCTAQARATISDLAHLCSAFVSIRKAFAEYFNVSDFDASDDNSGYDIE